MQGQPCRGRAAAVRESHEQPWLSVSSSAWGDGGERGWWVMPTTEQLCISQWGAVPAFPSAPSLASLLVTCLLVGQLQQLFSLPHVCLP